VTVAGDPIPRSSEAIHCTVSGCKRSIGIPAAFRRFGYVPAEWICQLHWARVPKDCRRAWRRILRLERRFGVEVRPAAHDRIWSALKRKAHG